MKNIKFLAGLSSLALMVSTFTANVTCVHILHQPKQPNAVKSLRKF